MRGRPVPIPVPTAGLVANLPPHLIPPNALQDGSNMFLDIDGFFKPRRGYAPLAPIAPSTNRISGGIGFQDVTGLFWNVAATQTNWYSFQSGTWTDITPRFTPNTGTADNPARFTVFFQNNAMNVLGVNNVNQMRQWTPGAAVFTTPNQGPIARDILTLANRVVAFNITSGGNQYRRRVQWSAVNDYTTWPALAYNDLLDSSDEIVGAAKTGRLSAIVFGSQSVWTIQANPGGSDASAFTAEELWSAVGYNGPIGTAAIVTAEGSIWYLGTDARVYQFNGIQPQPVSAPIDPVIQNQINFNYSRRCFSFYMPAQRLLVFFFPVFTNNIASAGDPMVAAVFSLARGAWEPLWTYSEGITAAWPTYQALSGTWQANPYTWAQVPYSWKNAPASNQQQILIGTTAGQVHSFFVGAADNQNIIPYGATGPLFSANPGKSYQLDRAEFYLQPTPLSESIAFQVDAFGAPGTTNQPVATFLADPSQTNWIYMMTEPGPGNPNNIPGNYLQVKLIGLASAGGFGFGGGNLYVVEENKGDYTAWNSAA